MTAEQVRIVEANTSSPIIRGMLRELADRLTFEESILASAGGVLQLHAVPGLSPMGKALVALARREGYRECLVLAQGQGFRADEIDALADGLVQQRSSVVVARVVAALRCFAGVLRGHWV